MVDNIFVFESQTFDPFDLSATDTYSLDVDPVQNFFHLLMSQRFVFFIVNLNSMHYLLLCLLIFSLLEYKKSS